MQIFHSHRFCSADPSSKDAVVNSTVAEKLLGLFGNDGGHVGWPS